MFRALETFMATILLLFFLPFFLVAILLVLIDSPGKIIFKQQRVGKHGKKFILYKLRTMKKNENGKFPVHTQVNDPRFSPLCRIIRATCIDEVPQLWNIIKGDMNFIGPRPELPNVVDTYTLDQKEILRFKPGLLGISQLVMREGVNYRLKLKIEDAYYPHRALLKDSLIIAITPFILVRHTLGRILPFFRTRNEYTGTRWFKWLMNSNGGIPMQTDDELHNLQNKSAQPKTSTETAMRN